jgi:hypothetical protein
VGPSVRLAFGKCSVAVRIRQKVPAPIEFSMNCFNYGRGAYMNNLGDSRLHLEAERRQMEPVLTRTDVSWTVETPVTWATTDDDDYWVEWSMEPVTLGDHPLR